MRVGVWGGVQVCDFNYSAVVVTQWVLRVGVCKRLQQTYFGPRRDATGQDKFFTAQQQQSWLRLPLGEKKGGGGENKQKPANKLSCGSSCIEHIEHAKAWSGSMYVYGAEQEVGECSQPASEYSSVWMN